MNERSKMLGSENVASLILKLSVPATIGMLVQALYNVVDAIFVGRGVGTLGLAGISIVFPIQIFVMAVAQMIGIGAGSVVSRSLGEKDFEKANRALGNAFVLSIFFGLSISIVVLLLVNSFLRLFGASETILPYARDYLSYIMFGTTFVLFGMALNAVVRAEGNAKVALYTMLLGAGMNIILDPLFIFGFKMGIKGAAIATVISQFATFVWLLSYYVGKKSILRIGARYLSIKAKLLWEIVAIGFSSFVRQVSASVVLVLINFKLAALGGDVAVTVYGLINRLASFAIMPSFGVSQGFQPIAGFNYGAKKYNRTIESLKSGTLFASGTTTFGFLVMWTLTEPLIRLFTSDAALIAQTVMPLRTVVSMFPLVGFMVVGATLFQAIGKPVEALMLSLARQVILLVPLILIMPIFLGVRGIWLSFPIADFMTFFLTLLLVSREITKLRYNHVSVTQGSAREVSETLK